MEIKTFNKKAMCNCCKNFFETGFEVDLNKRFFNNIKICQNCGKKIYTQLGKYFVPKSIKNINAKPKMVDQNFKFKDVK